MEMRVTLLGSTPSCPGLLHSRRQTCSEGRAFLPAAQQALAALRTVAACVLERMDRMLPNPGKQRHQYHRLRQVGRMPARMKAKFNSGESPGIVRSCIRLCPAPRQADNRHSTTEARRHAMHPSPNRLALARMECIRQRKTRWCCAQQPME